MKTIALHRRQALELGLGVASGPGEGRGVSRSQDTPTVVGFFALLAAIRENLSLRVVGQDLLKNHHEKFVKPPETAGATPIKRSGYARLEWNGSFGEGEDEDDVKVSRQMLGRGAILRARKSGGILAARSAPRWCATIALIAALLCPAAVRGQGQAGEYQVKAAFLFNFGKFVEWPEASFAERNSPFSICVLGEDPFGKTLDETIQGKQLSNHPVRITRTMDPAVARQCQIVFVSGSEKPQLSAVFHALCGSNALLVGEIPGFAAAGGAIELTFEDNHVRFAINPGAIRRAGLQISSQLLALAKIVREERNDGNG